MEIKITQTQSRKILELVQILNQLGAVQEDLKKQMGEIDQKIAFLTKNQTDLVETILEFNSVDITTITNLKIENNSLIFDFIPSNAAEPLPMVEPEEVDDYPKIEPFPEPLEPQKAVEEESSDDKYYTE